jgi:regulatory protein
MSINAKTPTTDKKTRKAPRKPKKISETYLHNAGLYYLQRYAASSAQFRKVMRRKIMKSCRVHSDQNLEECYEMLERLIVKFNEVGLLNDEVYTTAKVKTLRRQGRSQKYIHAKMYEKGIDSDLTAKHLSDIDGDVYQAEIDAARIFARKRKFKAFDDIKDGNLYKKALGAFARAGFSYDVAQAVLKEGNI